VSLVTNSQTDPYAATYVETRLAPSPYAAHPMCERQAERSRLGIENGAWA
jgi:hypothetical protein